MGAHVDEATLNALVDDALGPAERRIAESHLERCASCAAEVAALRVLRARIGALPRGIAPARDLLAGIHERIDAAAVVPLHADAPSHTSRPLPLSQRTVRGARRELAAAAVALVILSSAATAVLLGGRGEPAASPSARSTTAP